KVLIAGFQTLTEPSERRVRFLVGGKVALQRRLLRDEVLEEPCPARRERTGSGSPSLPCTRNQIVEEAHAQSPLGSMPAFISLERTALRSAPLAIAARASCRMAASVVAPDSLAALLDPADSFSCRASASRLIAYALTIAPYRYAPCMR